jgi:hypothetical protein
MSEERKALKAARAKLERQIGGYIGSAYGYAEGFDQEPEEFLIVWSDDPNVQFPKTFEGFKVVKRGIPRAL